MEKECLLLSGLPAFFSQILLGIIAISALIYKHRYKLERHQEARTNATFLLDVSKQLVSLVVAHISGLIIAILIAHSTTSSVSECAWYFVVYCFDTTLGVLLTLSLHALVKRTASTALDHLSTANTISYRWKIDTLTALVHCGEYGSPPHLSKWLIQTIEFSTCVILARLVCGFTIALVLEVKLRHVAAFLDGIFEGHPAIMLNFFVMITCPLLLNACQLIVQDAYLMAKSSLLGRGEAVQGGGGVRLGDDNDDRQYSPKW